jgi:GNAT superfamily N-acetyltransferase
MYRYRLAELPSVPRVDVSSIRRDHLSDLDLYEPSAPWWLPKSAFLDAARERLAAGEHIYTYATPNRLLHYAWLADRRESMVVYEVDQTFHYAIPGAMLYDAHTIPEARGQGLHTRSLAARLSDARSLASVRWAYVGCLADNYPSRAVIQKSGFAYYTSLYRRKTFGFAKRWQGTEHA